MYKLPRGTRDFTQTEKHQRNYLETQMRKTFQQYGYHEIETPVFETLDLFTAKSGENIIEELYSFTDKSGRNLALRPELTAPVIRMYIDKLQMQPKPQKLFYFGNCYRYDRPQKGRYREFKQAGCELIGTNTPEAHAELIALAYNILTNTGLKHINLHIGNLTILKTIFKKFGIQPEQQKYMLPLIDKEQYNELETYLQENNINTEHTEQLFQILQTQDLTYLKTILSDNELIQKEINNLEQIISLLNKTFNIPNITLKMSIVRGLDYYQGIVFEIEAPHLGAEKQLCGGGAYDLIELFGGTPTPTAGFAIGFDRTHLALLEEQHHLPQPTLDVYIIPFNEQFTHQAIQIAQKLRHKHHLTVDIDLLRRGIGKALKYANSQNATYTIILGEDEHKQNAVTLRNMSTGKQELIPLEKLPQKLTKTTN